MDLSELFKQIEKAQRSIGEPYTIHERNEKVKQEVDELSRVVDNLEEKYQKKGVDNLRNLLKDWPDPLSLHNRINASKGPTTADAFTHSRNKINNNINNINDIIRNIKASLDKCKENKKRTKNGGDDSEEKKRMKDELEELKKKLHDAETEKDRLLRLYKTLEMTEHAPVETRLVPAPRESAIPAPTDQERLPVQSIPSQPAQPAQPAQTTGSISTDVQMGSTPPRQPLLQMGSTAAPQPLPLIQARQVTSPGAAVQNNPSERKIPMGYSSGIQMRHLQNQWNQIYEGDNYKFPNIHDYDPSDNTHINQIDVVDDNCIDIHYKGGKKKRKTKRKIKRRRKTKRKLKKINE
jgi:hypothetical protein